MKRILVFAALLLTAAGPSPVDKQYQRDEQLLVNPGAENGLTQWTNTGSGTLALTTTAANVAAGAAALSWDAAANNDVLRSARMTVPAGLFGAKCIGGAAIKGGDTSLTLQVVDGSDVVLGSSKLSANTNYAQEVVEFTCPSSGTVALRLLSSGNAAIAYVDQTYLGRTTPPYITTTGEGNAIANPYAARNSSGYASTGTVTVARLASGGPLSPLYDTGLRLDGGSAADYASNCFQVPTNYKNRKLKAQWEQTPEGGAASGEWKVEVYGSANSDCSSGAELALSTDLSGTSLIPASSGRFTTYFNTDSNAYYQVRWVRVTGANHLDITELVVGPGTQPQGAIVSGSDSVALSPSLVNGTGLTQGGVLTGRRVGDRLHLSGTMTFIGSGSSGSTFAVNYSGLTLSGGSCTITARRQASPDVAVPIRASSNGTGLNFVVADLVNNNATELVGTLIGDTTSGDYDAFYFADCAYNVAEWAGNGTTNLAQNDVYYVSHDGSSITYGPTGAAVPTSTPAGTSESLSIDAGITGNRSGYAYVLEIQSAGSGVWTPPDGFEIEQPRFDGTNFIGAGVRNNAGVVEIYRGKYRRGLTNTWGTLTASTRWRVRVSAPGQAVGFANADSTARGLMYGKQVLSEQSVTGIGDNVVTDVGSGTLTITPGTYLVSYGCRVSVTLTVDPTNLNALCYVTDSANTILASELVPTTLQTTTLRRGATAAANTIVVAATTVVKLRGLIDNNAGTVSSRDVPQAFMTWERIQ